VVAMSLAALVEKGSGAVKPPMKPPTLPLATENSPKSPTPAGARREVIALDEGDVVLTFPENLSADSYQDLADYLGLFLRKAKRRAEIRDRHKDPEYLAMRRAEMERRASQTDDEE